MESGLTPDLEQQLAAEEARLRAEKDAAYQLAVKRPTSKNLKACKEAEKALQEFLEALHSTAEEQTFKNILEVVSYLDSEGWKIKKTTAYEHRDEDKLTPRADGRFTLSAVLEYAAAHLQKKDGSAGGNNLQELKIYEQIRQSRADADLRELKFKERMGELIPRSQVEAEQAERVTSLDSYFSAVFRSSAGRIIKIVKGDPQKSAELISWLLEMKRKAFDNYARPIKGLEEEEE